MSRIVKMEVYPVAGKDCMELNLSGAHAPYFTRNIVVLYDENWEPLATRDWEAAAFQSALLVTGTEIPGLLAAGIDVHDASNPEPIYTLSVACQTEVTQ